MKVAYVEDDLIQATVVSQTFADQQIEASHFKSGYDLLAQLSHQEYDVILTDYHMPNMNGLQLLGEVKSKQIDTPVVLLTATDDVSIAFDALKSGAADFITKDINGAYLSLLEPVLNRTISNHQQQLNAKKLTQDLDRAKQLAYLTLDALSESIVVIDENDKILYYNQHFEELCGLEPNARIQEQPLEWLSKLLLTVGDFGNDKDYESVTYKIQQCLDDTELSLELNTTQYEVYELQCAPLGDSSHILTLTDISHKHDQIDYLNRVLDTTPVAMLAINSSGHVVLSNQRAEHFFTGNQGSILGYRFNDFMPLDTKRQFGYLFGINQSRVDQMSKVQGVDLELLDLFGNTKQTEVSINPLILENEACLVITVVDISKRKEAEELIKQAGALTQSIIDHSPFSIVATDEKGTIQAVSPALEKMLWYQRQELVGNVNVSLFSDSKELNSRAAQLESELSCRIHSDFETLTLKAQRGVIEGFECSYVRKDGSKVPVNLTVSTLKSDKGKVSGYLFVSYDITEQIRAQEYIQHIAHHDALTALPNRTLMQDRLDTELLRAKRNHNACGVMVLDLDRFKRINDSLGHLAGDELLKTVAERLKASVRESDTVCRMGGDEFVVLVPDINSNEDLERIANKILENVAAPIVVGIHTLSVTPSIGACLAPQQAKTTQDALKFADIAMYHAKKAGRNGFKIFHEGLAQNKMANIAIEQALHEAFRAEKLEVHYQPQIDPQENKVVGFEALLRWDDPEKGPQNPAQFIPVAEQTGLIVALGDWVLKQACMEIQSLRLRHRRPYRVAVNVSPRQLEHPDFLSHVENALKNSGLPASALDIEITESSLLSEDGKNKERLQALRNLGVLVSIDDFGTGYSSLSYVSKYPVSAIKIDRCFMQLQDKANVAIVSAVVAISRELGISVVAEGVEKCSQLEFLQSRGCDYIQGFLYSPALPLAALDHTIKDIEAGARKHSHTLAESQRAVAIVDVANGTNY